MDYLKWNFPSSEITTDTPIQHSWITSYICFDWSLSKCCKTSFMWLSTEIGFQKSNPNASILFFNNTSDPRQFLASSLRFDWIMQPCSWQVNQQKFNASNLITLLRYLTNDMGGLVLSGCATGNPALQSWGELPASASEQLREPSALFYTHPRDWL